MGRPRKLVSSESQEENVEEKKKNRVSIETSINSLRAKLDKKYGVGSISVFGQAIIPQNLDFWPLESMTISDIFGNGRGLVKGRIIEIYGQESSGKTTLCQWLISQVQKEGGICAYIDVEHSFSLEYASKFLDMSKLLFSQPESGEMALGMVEDLVRESCSENPVGLIVVDSVAALTPQKELDGEIGDAHMCLQARMMGQAMRKIRGIVREKGVTVIFINQVRDMIGTYGNPAITPGGKALKFFSSIRVELKKVELIMKGDEPNGILISVRNVKNKVATPYKKGFIELLYESGFSVKYDCVEYAIKNGIIKQGGAWYTYDDKRWQGSKNVTEYFKENIDELEVLRDKVVKFLNKSQVVILDQVSEEDEMIELSELGISIEESNDTEDKHNLKDDL